MPRYPAQLKLLEGKYLLRILVTAGDGQRNQLTYSMRDLHYPIPVSTPRVLIDYLSLISHDLSARIAPVVSFRRSLARPLDQSG